MDPRPSRLNLLLLLAAYATSAHAASCSSSTTCPLHAIDAKATCWIKSLAQMWNYGGVGGDDFSFPGKGLFTIAKISKDVSNCCHDLKVQAFMSQVLRNGNAVRAPHSKLESTRNMTVSAIQ